MRRALSCLALLTGCAGTLTVYNQTGQSVTYIYFSSTSDPSWGDDRLGTGVVLPDGQRESWSVMPGAYNVRVKLADGTDFNSTEAYDVAEQQETVVLVTSSGKSLHVPMQAQLVDSTPPPPPSGGWLSVPGAFDGALGSGQTIDLTMSLGASGLYSFSTAGSSFDTVLSLMQHGVEQARADDSPGLGVQSCIRQRLAAGQYVLRVSGYQSASGSFVVEAQGPLPLPTVAPGQDVVQGLAPGTTEDVALSVPAAGAYALISADSAFDTILELYDGNGAQLGRDDDGGTGTSARLVLRHLVPGVAYRARVVGYQSGGGQFRLALRPLSLAAPVGCPGQARGQLPPWGWFETTVTLPAGDYEFDTIGSDFDTVLSLVDAAGDEVARDDDGVSASGPSRISSTGLAAATYTLRVEGLNMNGRTGDVVVNVAPRGIAPGPAIPQPLQPLQPQPQPQPPRASMARIDGLAPDRVVLMEGQAQGALVRLRGANLEQGFEYVVGGQAVTALVHPSGRVANLTIPADFAAGQHLVLVRTPAGEVRAELSLRVERESFVELTLGPVTLRSLPPGECELGQSTIGVGGVERADEDADALQEPARWFTLPRRRLLSRHEVTQAAYEALMGSNPSRTKGANLPVHDVTYDEAERFCEELLALARKTPEWQGKIVQVRLPSEDEWEYACRAGTRTPIAVPVSAANRRPFPERLAEVAWFQSHVGPGGGGPFPTGTLAANAWGFFDLHGNVSEWCRAGDDLPPPPAGHQPVRGGSWVTSYVGCRSSNRDLVDKGTRTASIGFRVLVVTR